MSKLTVLCCGWPKHERNTLRGFATLQIPELQLPIKDCAVHEKNHRRWVQLPARPMLDGQHELVRKTDGKIQYVSILQWANREVSDAFNVAAITVIQDYERGISPAGSL